MPVFLKKDFTAQPSPVFYDYLFCAYRWDQKTNLYQVRFRYLTEGLNSFIQAIKANARGFRRFESYRTAILFYLGKLTMLLSATHTKP